MSVLSNVLLSIVGPWNGPLDRAALRATFYGVSRRAGIYAYTLHILWTLTAWTFHRGPLHQHRDELLAQSSGVNCPTCDLTDTLYDAALSVVES